MANLDLEPLDLEPVEKESKLDLEPVDHPAPIEAPEERPWYKPSLAGIKEAAIEQLPAEGAMIGGLIGGLTTAGPGAIPGAAGGGALGAGLRKLIRDYQSAPDKKEFITKTPTLSGTAEAFKEMTPEMAGGAIEGTTQEMGGQALGAGLNKILSRKALESAGSKLAASSAGLKPSEDTAMKWVAKEGGRFEKVPDASQMGIGQTAIEQGAVPNMGTMDQRVSAVKSALDNNYNKLDPLLKNAQQSLDPKLDEVMGSVGSIGDKLGNYHYDFQNQLAKGSMEASGTMSTQAEQIANKLLRQNAKNIENASNIDGNLIALNALKRNLQADADRLGAYGPRQDKPQAKYLKGMASIIRQHIEDLANAANPGSKLGDQVAEANSNINKLMDFKDALETSKQSVTTPLDVSKSIFGHGMLSALGYKLAGTEGAIALPVAAKGVQMGVEGATGQPISTTAKILGAKGALKAAKVVDSPIGDITLKTVPKVVSAKINPFSASQFKQQTSEINPTDSTKVASLMYNANDESLKNMSNNFKQDPSMQNIANALDKYIKTKDTQDLNVATFLMLQNRNAVKLLTGEK